MYVIPTKGRIVPDPQNEGEPLPSEGREVPEIQYWYRRLKDGDVTKAPKPKPKDK